MDLPVEIDLHRRIDRDEAGYCAKRGRIVRDGNRTELEVRIAKPRIERRTADRDADQRGRPFGHRTRAHQFERAVADQAGVEPKPAMVLERAQNGVRDFAETGLQGCPVWYQRCDMAGDGKAGGILAAGHRAQRLFALEPPGELGHGNARIARRARHQRVDMRDPHRDIAP